MNEVVHEYSKKVPDLPADPDIAGDLCIARQENTYNVLPLSPQGFSFVVDHHQVGSVDENTLRVPGPAIFPFMNEVFDSGLRVI